MQIKVKRIKLFLSVFSILFIINSLIFEVHEAGHECSGEDCEICHLIENSALIIKLMKIEVGKKKNSILVPLAFSITNKIKISDKNIFLFSLISQKKRINE